jgi:hypothetical protein
MLPILHPLEKTKIELKRGIQRVDLFTKVNSDERAKEVLELLKRAHEIIDSMEE